MRLFSKKAGLSKAFLVAASAYRRELRNDHNYKNLDFSLDALQAQYKHETFGGEKPNPKSNGYTYGKSVFDITTKAIIEDIQHGHMCKAEVMENACALRRNILKNVMVSEFFPWRAINDTKV